MSILKPLALQKALDQANSGGVYASMLLNQSGSPIAQAVLDNERPTASIAAHIWKVRTLCLGPLVISVYFLSYVHDLHSEL